MITPQSRPDHILEKSIISQSSINSNFKSGFVFDTVFQSQDMFALDTEFIQVSISLVDGVTLLVDDIHFDRRSEKILLRHKLEISRFSVKTFHYPHLDMFFRLL